MWIKAGVAVGHEDCLKLKVQDVYLMFGVR